jgi:hypothetical protein
MKGLLFFLVVFGIALVLWTKSTEGFQEAEPQLNIPLISPRYQTLTSGEVQAFAPPSTALLAPPPGQSASVNTQPASDPAMEKAKAGRIQSVYESLTGFFKTDANGLQKLGDPSIQLPLSTARSDVTRLKDEMAVLSRNPGLESNLTGEDLDGIEANLGYLQKKWRMSVNANSGSPMPSEGFQGRMNPEGFQSGSGTGSGSGSGSGKVSDVKVADLTSLSTKINVEIIRLSASGTTDLNTQSRINVLRTVKKSIDDLISEVTNGIRLEKNIPFMMADINGFLPAMSNFNTAIPDLIKDSGLSKFLNSLFPMFGVGDISGAAIAKQMFEAYGKDFLNNLSWDVALSYKGQAEQNIANNYAKGSLRNISSKDDEEEANAAPNDVYGGLLHSVVSSATGMDPTHVSAGMGKTSASGSGKTAGAANEPQTLDWKQRSAQICAQISARGMDPNDFGCLVNPDAMKQESFSWRGYTRMICGRLNTVYDTSVPFLCGCPPQTWPGWKQ